MKKAEFKALNDLTTFLQVLDVDTLYYPPKTIKKHIKKVKKKLASMNIDLTTLSQKQRKSLGFSTWSEDSEQNGLIPLWAFNLLPKKQILICPIFDEAAPKEKQYCSDDTRSGCVAYEFYRGTKD